MIITISGQAGSGKSTVGKILADKLGYVYYSIGTLRRRMAKERGIRLSELNRLGEAEEFTDREVDEYQKKLGKKKGNFVVDGRLSFHFIPNSVKIYLKADLKTRARRVFTDERIAEGFKSLKDAENELKDRERSDLFRYKKYYGIKFIDKKNYDIVIDTSHITAEEVAEKILNFLKEKGKI